MLGRTKERSEMNAKIIHILLKVNNKSLLNKYICDIYQFSVENADFCSVIGQFWHVNEQVPALDEMNSSFTR